MTNVRIVTDSACDLPGPLADSLGIEIVPLTIRFGEQEFVDRVDLSPAEFWARCASSPTLPETAAPPPGAFEDAFRRIAAEGADAIVCINLSSALSATMQSAELAARNVAGDVAGGVRVEVIDSRSVTMGLGMIAVAAARHAAEGAELDDVVGYTRSLVTRTRVFGALDTLDNLKKGGRIGGAKALVASVLSIKPLIEVRDGRVEEAGKQRTRSRALSHLVDIVAKHKPVENLAVMHADASDVDQLVERLVPYYDGEIVVGDIGAVIGTHAGRGATGVIFQTL